MADDLGTAHLRHREQAHRQQEPITDLYRRLLVEQDAAEAKAAAKPTPGKTEKPKEPANG